MVAATTLNTMGVVRYTAVPSRAVQPSERIAALLNRTVRTLRRCAAPLRVALMRVVYDASMRVALALECCTSAAAVAHSADRSAKR